MTNDVLSLQEHLNRLLSEAPNGTQANDLWRQLAAMECEANIDGE